MLNTVASLDALLRFGNDALGSDFGGLIPNAIKDIFASASSRGVERLEYKTLSWPNWACEDLQKSRTVHQHDAPTIMAAIIDRLILLLREYVNRDLSFLASLFKLRNSLAAD